MDEATLHITAPPDVVYDLVADITNMGRWSPETHRAEWVGTPDRPVAGARFRGWNRITIAGVPVRWRTTAVVRRADRGRTFSFDVPFSGSRWTYRIEPDDRGCSVTETRQLLRRPAHSRVLDAAVGPLRTRQLTDGMAATLRRLKVAAERPPSEPDGG